MSHFGAIGIHPKYGYSPNWAEYLSYELTDSIVVVTLRYKSTLVGYCMYLIGAYKHNKNVLYADLDAIWISPAFRSGFYAMKMMRLGEEKLKGRVSFVTATSSKKYPIDPLLLRRGFEEAEVLYWKALDDGK